MKRSRILLWVCPVVAAGVIAGCGGSGDSTATTQSAGTDTTTTSTAPDVRTFSVAYRDGKVTGDTDISVARGTPVEIRVTSDVDDEGHLHGYDLLKEISAGQTVTYAFTADFPGKYALEFHHHNVRLLTLAVK